MRQAWWSCLVLACGGEMQTPASSAIAVASDFDGYEAWESVALPGADGGSFHDSGARTVFINRRPPAGSAEFPPGTLIVKQQDFDTLAMSKRGGTYNAKGALGWEWLDLVRSTSDKVVIKWRGLGPPAGEEYKKSLGTCNDCHQARVDNDSVLTDALKLR